MAGDDQDTHETIERFERIWVGFSLVLIVVFVSLVFYAVSMHGGHIGHAEPRQDPQQILAMEEFGNPGVKQTGENRYQVNMVAMAFSFVPDVIEIPAGAEVTFRMTSQDVIHGFQVRGTGINVELIPGDISSLKYTFDRPGEYLMICNQYCGLAHQNMLGRVVVTDPDAEMAEVKETEPEATDWRVAAEGAYNAQCAACHQRDGSGVRGAFPPLADHVPALAAPEGGREYLIDLVLYGLAGAIEVKGVNYRGMMPGMARLSNDDVAATLNHALLSWGNEEFLPEGFELITTEEVEQRRGLGLSPADVLQQRQALGLN